MNHSEELESFINDWEDTPEGNKKVFLRLRDVLASKPDTQLEFVPRPGVTYSLRATHPNLKGKPLFAMVDVIEDQPRWLSVCFFGELIQDPEEKADFVPEGLMGEDAMCFDLYSYDEDEIQYVEARLEDAYQSASRG